MGGLILFIFYGSIVFFIIFSILRVKKCINAPIHLHWELYKGSSIYEASEWWDKSYSTFKHKVYELLLEIIFLRDFYHRNKRFWYPLYLFHIGLYSLFLWHIWLFFRSISGSIETVSNVGWIWGTISTIITFIGGIIILFLRIWDEELKIYYTPIHYIKWIFVLLTLAGGIYAVDIHFQSNMFLLLKYVKEQVTFADFEKKLHPSFGPALHIMFASMWLIYLPFSHVYNLFFRYYHYLRWDDVPTKKGSKIERRIKENLDRPVSWSAPHIKPRKQWRDAVSEAKFILKNG